MQTIAYDAPVLDIVGSLLEDQPKRGKRLFDLVLAATLKYHGVTGQLNCAVSFTVLLEFLHVTTDSKRFDPPLTTQESIEIVQKYWNASNWKRLLPIVTTGNRALDLLQKHRLGRKRLLDAYLVATLLDNDVNALITCDRTDFRIFDDLALIDPLAE